MRSCEALYLPSRRTLSRVQRVETIFTRTSVLGRLVAFAIAGVICACAALAYAEVATMIPASGSAYTYSYVVFGELIAWMIGVALILEYTLVVSAVVVGWSGYAAGFLKSIHLGLPDALIQGPELGGVLNLPAIFIIWVVAGLLIPASVAGLGPRSGQGTLVAGWYAGLTVLALGKLGSRELNYSSDVDLILLFDPVTMPRRARPG